MTSRRRFGKLPPESIPDPFAYPRTDAQIRADLANQLKEILSRWERQVHADRMSLLVKEPYK